MGKKPTPDPDMKDSLLGLGFFWGLVLLSFALAVTAVRTGWLWLLLLCIPGFAMLVDWGYGKVLLFRAILAYQRRGIAGVLVSSDSPNWNAYIRENWLERFGERFVVLNWSQRKQWDKDLATRLFFHFCQQDENFCPAIIHLRGLRYPLVFQFFYAFRDRKHGNENALRKLEGRLFQELGLERQI